MKKFLLSLTLLSILSLNLFAQEEEIIVSKDLSQRKIEQVKYDVTITLPPLLSIILTSEFPDLESMEEEGRRVSRNLNGTLNIEMTHEAHQEMLKEYDEVFKSAVNDLVLGEDAPESILQISYNKEVTQFKIYVDSSLVKIEDQFSALALSLLGKIYHLIREVPNNEINIKILFIDYDTNEIIKESNLSQLIQTLSSILQDISDFEDSDLKGLIELLEE